MSVQATSGNNAAFEYMKRAAFNPGTVDTNHGSFGAIAFGLLDSKQKAELGKIVTSPGMLGNFSMNPGSIWRDAALESLLAQGTGGNQPVNGAGATGPVQGTQNVQGSPGVTTASPLSQSAGEVGTPAENGTSAAAAPQGGNQLMELMETLMKAMESLMQALLGGKRPA
jgi:hypothetical protein